jgi:hypothetical protein
MFATDDRVEGNRRGRFATFAGITSSRGPARSLLQIAFLTAGIGCPLRVALQAAASVRYGYSADTFVDAGGFTSSAGAGSFLALDDLWTLLPGMPLAVRAGRRFS